MLRKKITLCALSMLALSACGTTQIVRIQPPPPPAWISTPVQRLNSLKLQPSTPEKPNSPTPMKKD